MALSIGHQLFEISTCPICSAKEGLDESCWGGQTPASPHFPLQQILALPSEQPLGRQLGTWDCREKPCPSDPSVPRSTHTVFWPEDARSEMREHQWEEAFMGGALSYVKLYPLGIGKSYTTLNNSQILCVALHFSTFFFFFLRNFFLKQEELGDSPWQDPPRLQCQGTKSRLVRRDTLIFLDSKDSSFCFCCWGSVKHKDRKKWILELDKPDFKFHLCHWTVTSDKWFIHPKLHFLIKLQWSLKWENNAYLMRSLQELNETVFY